MERDSFVHFYYEKVALSEGCGCAEHIIGTRDLDAWWRDAARRQSRRGVLEWVATYLRTLQRE